MKLPIVSIFLSLATGLAGPVAALDIQFSYVYDSQGFFNDPIKKQVLEAAAVAWESKLAGVALPEIPLGKGMNTWSLKFNRPDTTASIGGQNTSLVNKPLPENTVVIYVGGRPDVYGGFVGYAEYGYTMFGTSEWVNLISSRNTGTRFCSFGGAIAFDSDAAWHYDTDPSTKEEFTGLLDFYTIAMHEIGHLMGFNSGSAAFNRMSLGGKFNGERTKAVFGEAPRVRADGHWPSDLQFGGMGLVMRSQTTLGERVELSQLDVSVLQDLGYVAKGSVQVVLSPSTAIQGGARWMIDGGAERASGVTVPELEEGEYTISFKAVPGCFTPTSRVVKVVFGETTVVACDYVPVPLPKIAKVSGSDFVKNGMSATLEVEADGGGAPLTYIWRKAGKVLPGSKTANYGLNSVQLSHGGVYSVEVKSAGGSAGVTNVNLGVVGSVVGPDVVNEDGPITLTQSASGPGLTFQWFLGGQALSDDSVGGVSGANAAILRIRRSSVVHDGMYQCRIRMPDAVGGAEREAFGPGKKVGVRLRPVVETLSLGPWKVSGSVSERIVARNGPTSFRVTGLPAGVVLNRLDGRLSGRPLVPRTYRLGISASNLAGTSPMVFVDLVCADMEARAKGAFVGLVDRAEANGGLGGAISFNASPGGAISGSLSMGWETRSFRGAWESLPGPNLTGVVEVKRAVGMNPWVLQMDLDAETGRVTGSLLEVGNRLAGIEAWQSDWSLKSAPATDYGGFYAVALEPSKESVTSTARALGSVILTPEGVGYAAVTVTGGGAVTWVGRMADGTTLTRSLRLGREGAVPLHSLLYSGTGSVQGWVTIRPDLPSLLESEVAGGLSWVKGVQKKPEEGVYGGGFPLHDVTVTGGIYRVDAPIVEQLGLADDGLNMRLSFEGGWGVEVFDSGYFDVLVGISDANRIQQADSEENPDVVRLTRASVRTGQFQGEFMQRGVEKKTLFYGMLVPRMKLGVGWFLRSVTAEDGSVGVKSGRVDLQAK